MKVYNYVMLGYFLALFVVINVWGNAFLRRTLAPRLLIAGACFAPLVVWVIVNHVVQSRAQRGSNP